MRKDSAINTIFVSIIIAILIGVSLYTFLGKKNASKAKVTHDFLKIETAINEFKFQTSRFPSQEEGLDILLGSQDGLWNGPFLEKGLLFDPWGGKYQYINNKQIVFIASSGPNKKNECELEGDLQGKVIGDDLIKIIVSEKILEKTQ